MTPEWSIFKIYTLEGGFTLLRFQPPKTPLPSKWNPHLIKYFVIFTWGCHRVNWASDRNSAKSKFTSAPAPFGDQTGLNKTSENIWQVEGEQLNQQNVVMAAVVPLNRDTRSVTYWVLKPCCVWTWTSTTRHIWPALKLGLYEVLIHSRSITHRHRTSVVYYCGQETETSLGDPPLNSALKGSLWISLSVCVSFLCHQTARSVENWSCYFVPFIPTMFPLTKQYYFTEPRSCRSTTALIG